MNYRTEHFRLLKSVKKECGITVNIHVPKEGMGELPEQLVSYILDKDIEYQGVCNDPEHIRWGGGNCDMGIFDALMAKHYTKKKVDVYVCAILRRPFDKEDSETYGQIFLKDLKFRMTHIFDNHVKKGFTVFG